MFDANMRHLSKGKKFFCKVHYCDEHCKSFSLGIRKGDLFLCTMMDEAPENPSVIFHKKSGDVVISDRDDGSKSWIVYEGLGDGMTDFISEESQTKAMQILNKGC